MARNLNPPRSDVAEAINALARQQKIANLIAFRSTGGLPALTHAQQMKLDTKLVEMILR